MSVNVENTEARALGLPPGKGARKALKLAPGVHALESSYWDQCKESRAVQGFISAGWLVECDKPPGPPPTPARSKKEGIEPPPVSMYLHEPQPRPDVDESEPVPVEAAPELDEEASPDEGPEGIELTTDEARSAIRECSDTIILGKWLKQEDRKVVSELIGRRLRKLEKGSGD